MDLKGTGIWGSYWPYTLRKMALVVFCFHLWSLLCVGWHCDYTYRSERSVHENLTTALWEFPVPDNSQFGHILGRTHCCLFQLGRKVRPQGIQPLPLCSRYRQSLVCLSFPQYRGSLDSPRIQLLISRHDTLYFISEISVDRYFTWFQM